MGGGGNGRWRRAGGGNGSGGTSMPTPVDVAWRAGGDAWMWAASILGRAACTEYRKACEANDEADDALGMVAAAGGRAVGEDGRVDHTAMSRSAEEMRRASARFGAMSDAFGRSSRLHEDAAACEGTAAGLYERSGFEKYERLARDRTEKSRRHAAGSARMSAMSAEGRDALAEDAGRMDGKAKEWKASGGAWSGDMAAMARARVSLREDAKKERVRSAAMLGQAVDVERSAARVEVLAAAAARQTAAYAAVQRDDPKAQEALAAWREGMAAANKAEKEHPAGRIP